MISFILENLVTLKSIVPLESKLVLPHPKYSIKLLIRDSSLILWVNIKLNLIASPHLDVLFLKITTLKQPSASTKPDNPLGFIIWGTCTWGLKTVSRFGKAILKSLLIPLFITAFKATSSNNPSLVRWLLFFIKLSANLNNL